MRTIVSFLFVMAALGGVGCGGSNSETMSRAVQTSCRVRNVACSACRRVCDATEACEAVGGGQ